MPPRYTSLEQVLKDHPSLYTAYSLATIKQLSRPLPYNYLTQPSNTLLTVPQYLTAFLERTTRDRDKFNALVRDVTIKSSEGTSAWIGRAYLCEGLIGHINKRLLVTG